MDAAMVYSIQLNYITVSVSVVDPDWLALNIPEKTFLFKTKYN
jgi:hypothetical protein